MAAVSSIVMGTLGAVGAVSGAIGAGVKGAQAQKAAQEQMALARQKLQFAQNVYSDWEKTFGPVNQQLASHYAGLTTQSVVDRYRAAGDAALDKFNKQVTQQQQNMERQFARQGMSDGGQAAGMMNSLAMDAAERAAGINMQVHNAQLNADREVAAEKMQFANMGTQQRGQALSLMSDGYNSVIGAQGQQVAAHQQGMQNFGNMLGAGLQNIAGTLGMMDARNSNTTSNIPSNPAANEISILKPQSNSVFGNQTWIAGKPLGGL